AASGILWRRGDLTGTPGAYPDDPGLQPSRAERRPRPVRTPSGRRLCILAPAFFTERVGGIEVQTYLIAKHLRQRGWDVHFIAQTRERTKVGGSVLHEGIQVHWLGRRDLFAFFRPDLIRALRAIRPDVLYLRGRSRLTASPVPRRFTSDGR